MVLKGGKRWWLSWSLDSRQGGGGPGEAYVKAAELLGGCYYLKYLGFIPVAEGMR